VLSISSEVEAFIGGDSKEAGPRIGDRSTNKKGWSLFDNLKDKKRGSSLPFRRRLLPSSKGKRDRRSIVDTSTLSSSEESFLLTSLKKRC
jgi:hypothetical protein